jgi:hypothetical protein
MPVGMPSALVDALMGYQQQNAPPDLTEPDYTGAEQKVGVDLSLAQERGQDQQNQKGQAPVQKLTMTVGPDGLPVYDVKMSHWAVQWLQKQIGISQGVQSAADALSARLAAKQKVLEDHPVIAQLGQIASGAAANYRAPNSRTAPLVNAAGRAGLDYFSDTPESLGAQLVALQEKKLQAGEPIAHDIQAQANLQEAQRRDDNRFLSTRLGELSQQARAGLFGHGSAAELEQEMTTIPGMDASLAKSMAGSLERSSLLKQHADELKEDAKNNLESRKEFFRTMMEQGREQSRMAQTMAMIQGMDSRATARIASSEKIAGEKIAAEKAAADVKAQKLTPKESDEISAHSSALQQLDELEKMVKDPKNARFQGVPNSLASLTHPLESGLSPNSITSKFGGKEVNDFRSRLGQKITQVTTTYKAGARGFAPQEFNMFRPLLPDPSKSVEANLANLQAARELITQNLQGRAETLTARGVDLGKYPVFTKAGVVSGPTAGGDISPKLTSEFLKTVPAGKRGEVTDENGKVIGVFENRNGVPVKVQ